MVIVWNAAVVLIAIVWMEYMCYPGGFDPVAEFPLAGLSLAVLRS